MTFALHVLEEAPQFTAWVNKYASEKFTYGDFIRNNAFGMIMGVVLCVLVYLFPSRPIVFLFFLAGLWQAIFNTLFHVGTTAVYGAYLPGLITSTLYPVLFYYLSHLAYHGGLLSDTSAIISFVSAGVIHIFVVAKQIYLIKVF